MIFNLEVIILVILIISIWIIIGFLWRFIRNFFHNNYSYFDLSFIIVYFVEQFTLIVLLIVKPEYTSFLVSAFALLVVTTASIQKLAMDSKDKKVRELNAQYEILLEQAKEFYMKSKERESKSIDILKRIMNKLRDERL